VKRETRFVLSHRPYAVDLTSLRTKEHTRENGTHYYSGTINAVWFRRRRAQGIGDMLTVACVGTLWDYQDEQPADARAFLEAHDDGRYGGDCTGRWDGTGYWGQQEPDRIAADLALLRPMLANYPFVPDGYEGWWVF
jgi:hypothetical protein